jgi:hypothetical protein
MRTCGTLLRSQHSAPVNLWSYLAQTVPGGGLIAKIKRRAKLYGHHRNLLRTLQGFEQIITPVRHAMTPLSVGAEILRTGSLMPDRRELLLFNG